MTTNLVIAAYCNSHHRVAKFLQKLSDEQLHWQLNGTSLSIAWHGWHIARWADYFQASISGMTPELAQLLGEGVQIWHWEHIAQKWGFESGALGYAETGMNMSDDIAVGLPFPPKSELLDYIERAFAQAEKTLAQIDDVQFQSVEQSQPLTEGIYAAGTVGNAIMAHVTHINRHLGMMECLLGLQGVSGTSTR
jgi:hypothetical protein